MGPNGIFGRSSRAALARFTNSATRNGSVRGRSPGSRGASTPLATSTPVAGMVRNASATLAGSRPPARMTGTSRATADAASTDARRPVPPRAPGEAASTRIRAAPAARWLRADSRAAVAAVPSAASVGTRMACQSGRSDGPGLRAPLHWMASGSTAITIAATSSGAGSATTATIVGRRSVGAATRASRASSAASPRASRRGDSGARLSPIASAPARMAASTPSASVTPQILTMGRRATFAGSSGARPALTNERTAATGSADRMSASPTSAASNPRARQRATTDGSRTPDSAMTSRSSGTSDRSRSARVGSTSSVRRSLLFRPISRASVASAARSSLSSCASTSGSSPMASARSTSRASCFGGWRTASNSTRSAPAARSIGSWMSSTTNSLARTGIDTAARTARRSPSEPPNQCGSHRTEIAAAPPAS